MPKQQKNNLKKLLKMKLRLIQLKNQRQQMKIKQPLKLLTLLRQPMQDLLKHQ
jgi:hypothetical protein